SGAYYYDFLIKKFEYVEAVIFDTPIFIEDSWNNIHSISIAVNHEPDISKRMNLRKQRIEFFLDYIQHCEKDAITTSKIHNLGIYEELSKSLLTQTDDILNRISYYKKRK